MDFVTGLLCTQQGYDSILVIMDRLMKSVHFLSVKTTYVVKKYERVYLDEILRLNGVPVSIITN